MKKKLYICAFFIGICFLYAGCGKRAQAPVFEMEQDEKAGQGSEGSQDLRMDAETLKAVLEEALGALEFSPAVQVTCGCTGETQAQQAVIEAPQAIEEPADDGKVNINTADMAALQTLNGIGESRAQAIISYRESFGAFQSIEDIKQVDGIKDGIFNKISDMISVG